MSVNELIQAKMYRLEELRKYQSHYGPNTPYPLVVEINQLENELRRLLQAGPTRPTPVVKKPAAKKPVAKKSTPNQKKAKPPTWQFWRMSQATIDMIATIAFIGLVFLLGSIVVATYIHTRSDNAAAVAPNIAFDAPTPTRRPTFTPTADPNAPASAAAAPLVASSGDSFLPTPVLEATALPTPVPTLTPSSTPEATDTPMPTATLEPTPTSPPLPQLPTATLAPPTPPPAPSFPFAVVEQGNRMFQKTNYHVVTIYVAVVSEGNIPIGGYKVIGDHVPSGQHVESGLSTWNWDVVNCLDCDYVKQGNLKLEPGPFSDGVWNIYLADENGTPLSETVSLAYSTDPEQWVWDFVIFRRKSG